MNDNRLAKEYYLNAKADLKRDIKVLTIFSVVFAIAIFMIMILSNSIDIFENFGDALIYLMLCLIIGVQIACVPIGLIIVFRFTWKTFSYASLIFIIVLFLVAVGGAHIFAIAKFIIGYLNIRKLGKYVDTVTE